MNNDFRKFGNFLKQHNLTQHYWACVYKQGYSRKTIRVLYPGNYIAIIRNFPRLSSEDMLWEVIDTYWQMVRTGQVI